MNSSQALFELAFLRFRQIYLKNPTYFAVFTGSLYPFCPFSSLAHSPHVEPLCVNKYFRLKSFMRFFRFLFFYTYRLVVSIFYSDTVFISSSRWSNKSTRYARTLTSTFPKSRSYSHLYFTNYLDTSFSSSSSLSHILLRPAISAFVSGKTNHALDVNSEFQSEHLPSPEMFFNFLRESFVKDINKFALSFSYILFFVLIGFFDFLYILFPQKKIYFISTNCWTLNDYLFFILSFSKFKTLLVGCQHGCRYFESDDLYTALEISSPCFDYFFSFGNSISEFHPDDVLRLVPQSNRYDVVYIMKFVPLSGNMSTIPKEINRLVSLLISLPNKYRVQIRVHPKSKILYSLLKNKFTRNVHTCSFDIVLFDNKFVGLPSCSLAIFDSPFSTLVWHSVFNKVNSIFVDYAINSLSCSSLYSRKFLISDDSDDGLLKFITLNINHNLNSSTLTF